jgi:hypothetical protein
MEPTKGDITKALWYLENVYIYQGFGVGLFLSVVIHGYFLYKNYLGVAIIYAWLLGISFGYIHSRLRYITLIKDPKIFSGASDAEGPLFFKHPIEAIKRFIRFLVYEWYFFLFVAIMFIVPGFTASADYAIILFFLGLAIYGIFHFIFWKYHIRPKINEKYGK